MNNFSDRREGTVTFNGEDWQVVGSLGAFVATKGDVTVEAETLEMLRIKIRFLKKPAASKGKEES